MNNQLDHQMEYTHPLIEDILQQFQTVIGEDYDKYRNHVYRVFLNCLLLEDQKSNEAKYAIAAVFHDIGIWTNQTIDYLEPSVGQAKIYLEKNEQAEWVGEITLMINWHHKTTNYKGTFQETVEIFRKADWIDVSLGLLSFGADKKAIRATKRIFANKGFHFFLVKKVLKNLLKHPLNPLPMFRR